MPHGTTFTSKVPEGEKTTCLFTSSQNVTVWPVRITEARLTGVPPDIPSLNRYVPPDRQVRSALRLKLATTHDISFQGIKGLDRLPVYLAGDEQVASHLHELMHTSSLATAIAAPGQFGSTSHRPCFVTENAVDHDGLRTDQNLLPLTWPKFHGHNLLHEYFACPARFWFSFNLELLTK